MQESIILVKDLSKEFRVKKPTTGLKNKLKNFIKPKTNKIQAVNKINFSLKEGEVVGFIGPNGAGKSTTLKMLSGILCPDGGEISIMDLNPQKQRKKLAYSIGTIFGQKPQLWFHLPAIDSFNLFSHIYELDKKEYKKRLNYLIKKFELKEIINQPVRKLSLGQRMRCEFVLALLHKPKVLFLDEPTIGMDITIKKSIRELIKKINQEEKVTVILTSHDMNDIEGICQRLIIINTGKIIYDGPINKIKQKYTTKKLIKVVTENEPKIKQISGTKIIKQDKYGFEIEINTKKSNLSKVVEKIFDTNEVNDITIEEPPIEDIIENIFNKEKNN